MLKYFLSFTLLVAPSFLLAYEVVLVEQPSPFEISTVKDITTEQWLVGQLQDFPHTFEFLLTEPTVLRVQVMVPETASDDARMSLIAIREVTRGVEEVMRRSRSEVAWTEFRDPVSKLPFNESQYYEDKLEPGIYRVEVSNPINVGQYVLKLGMEDDEGGYFNTLGDIKTLRTALGYSTIGMIGNKYVYVPLFGLCTLVFFGWWYRKQQSTRHEVSKEVS